MNAVAWLILLAALLPLLTAAASKAGGQAFDNKNPRAWLARQEGWRARADAAQKNQFEALPFYYAAVLFALYNQADTGTLALLMGLWLGLRALYIVLYLLNYSTLRSLVWAAALGANIAVLFTGSPA